MVIISSEGDWNMSFAGVYLEVAVLDVCNKPRHGEIEGGAYD